MSLRTEDRSLRYKTAWASTPLREKQGLHI